MGVTLYCLIYGQIPFDGENEFDVFRAIGKNQYDLAFLIYV
jgi:hypothetical protein